jgi:hypothetical protein
MGLDQRCGSLRRAHVQALVRTVGRLEAMPEISAKLSYSYTVSCCHVRLVLKSAKQDSAEPRTPNEVACQTPLPTPLGTR